MRNIEKHNAAKTTDFIIQFFALFVFFLEISKVPYFGQPRMGTGQALAWTRDLMASGRNQEICERQDMKTPTKAHETV